MGRAAGAEEKRYVVTQTTKERSLISDRREQEKTRRDSKCADVQTRTGRRKNCRKEPELTGENAGTLKKTECPLDENTRTENLSLS
jgi:hypothetical protein